MDAGLPTCKLKLYILALHYMHALENQV